VLVVFLAGCSHTQVNLGAGSPHGVTLFGLSILAAGIVDTQRPRYAPEMDPERKISEQDCTKPLDYSLGNIRCR
jgi:hypothetical protein